jgi:hypothetical protein
MLSADLYCFKFLLIRLDAVLLRRQRKNQLGFHKVLLQLWLLTTN